MKAIKRIVAAVVWCAVSTGCVAEESKPKDSNHDIVKRIPYLTLEKGTSEVCRAYIKHFNDDVGEKCIGSRTKVTDDFYEDHCSLTQRENFYYRNDLEYNSCLDAFELGTGFYANTKKTCDFWKLRNDKAISGEEFTPVTDFSELVEDAITGFVPFEPREKRHAWQRVDAKIYEAFADINRNGKQEHLIRYRSDPGFGTTPNLPTDYVFVIQDDPLSFSVDFNKKLFPLIFEDNFYCGKRVESPRVIKNSFINIGVDEWFFKYKNKFYYDIFTPYRVNKKYCNGFDYPYDYDDLENTVFLFEVENEKPTCIFHINQPIYPYGQ